MLSQMHTRAVHVCADSTALSEQYKLSQSTTEESIIDQGMNSNYEYTTSPVQDILPESIVLHMTLSPIPDSLSHSMVVLGLLWSIPLENHV